MERSNAVVGRYVLSELIGSGGMARVYAGRMEGWAGFSKAVAVKRLHPDLARDPEFSAMLLDEARLTAHIRHPNVVSTQDVVREDGEFLLVMDYVVGVSLDVLFKAAIARDEVVPEAIVSAVVIGMLHGLHAAHDAHDEHGKALAIVHRDMSPPNVIVDESGVVKILDFGIATASNRLTMTKEGSVKGKPSYIAPEQLERGAVDRRADLFAVGVMLWELLAGRRLRAAASFGTIKEELARDERIVDPAVERASAPATSLGEIALRAMRRDPSDRFPTALAMAHAVEAAVPSAPPSAVAEWCARLAPDHLRARKTAALHASSEVTPKAAEPTVIAAATAIVPLPPNAARGRARVVPIVVAGLLFTGIAVAGIGAVVSRTKPTAVLAPSADSAAPALPAVAAVPEPAAIEPVPVGSTIAVAAPANPKSSRPHGAARGSRGTKPASASDTCREPFRIDANGVKIPKRECL